MIDILNCNSIVYLFLVYFHFKLILIYISLICNNEDRFEIKAVGRIELVLYVLFLLQIIENYLMITHFRYSILEFKSVHIWYIPEGKSEMSIVVFAFPEGMISLNSTFCVLPSVLSRDTLQCAVDCVSKFNCIKSLDGFGLAENDTSFFVLLLS